MEIKSGFYLTGFTRIDKGEEGAVFVRYDEPAAKAQTPEINEAFLEYGGKNSESYILTIPRQLPRNVVAVAIVTRTSKNCYSATAFGERLIDTFKADSLDGLRGKVARFFAEESKNTTKKCSSGGF